jgi:hypothetical protein
MRFTTQLGKGTYVLCMLGILLSPFQASGQLVLNEMMASNASALEDQFNNYPDWIEIYNSGASAVELGNYWLSDDSTILKKWNLPVMALSEDSYLVIFASGKDLSKGLTYWHTVVNAGDEWRAAIPTSQLSNDWKTSTSFTAAWKTGASGFGYNDNDDATELPITISFYMQKEFQLESIEEVNDAALFMDYDDGFVAYLNGTEIARSSNMGEPGTPVSFDQAAEGNREALMYNGGAPEVHYISDSLSLLKEGSNILAIEVHNVSPTSSDMSGIPFFLVGYDRIKENLLYRNPFFSVKETYPHANFKIQSAGESIFLSDNDGSIVDQIANIQLPTDFSYGRIHEQDGQFGYFAKSTPAEANTTPYSTDYFTDSVDVILQGMNFDTTQTVRVESKLESDIIRYTTDGSLPDKNDPVFDGLTTFDETTVIKARIFRVNSLPGPVTTRTVFVGEGHELPVISVSMEPADLWDYNSGIYVMGPNAEANNPHQGANFWQDWERPAHFELYNENQELVFAQDAGTKIFGGWSRAHDQRSMSFFARSSYGKGSFKYPLFSERSFDKYESFVLRNDGNDWCNGLFRDAISASMSAKMDVDHQAYEPYVMYLNGEYWGIINMREKINEHFIASNHDVHPDNVNLTEGQGWAVHGSSDRYNQMYDYVCNMNLNDQEAYDSVKTMIDVQNFISFWALNIYVDNKDWPANNNKFWSSNSPGSLYRWISYDTDFGYSIWDAQAYKVNTLQFSMSKGKLTWANQLWATAMMRSLLRSKEFKDQYVNEYADRMNTTFHPDVMIPVVDSFQLRVMNEAPDHYERWIKDPNNWLSYNSWLGIVERIRTYFIERPAYMRQHLMDEFGISGTADINVQVSDEQAGNVKLNNIELHTFPFEGTYFKDVPIRLEAVPAPGYVFSHWSGRVDTDTTAFHFSLTGNTNFVAHFEAVDSVPNIVINEINYASHDTLDTEDWVELYNNSGTAVDLSAWSLVDGFTNDTFMIPDATIIPADGYMVFGRSLPDFKLFHPELQPVIGTMSFGLNSDSDGLALNDADGQLHDYVFYKNEAPWPITVSGTGLTLERVNPALNSSYSSTWKASLDTLGTPCAKNSRYADFVVKVPEVKREGLRANVYPSPFRESTNIRFSLDEEEKVMISIYSASGSLVDIIADAEFDAGRHELKWTPKFQISAGIYFINIRSGQNNKVLKVLFQ